MSWYGEQQPPVAVDPRDGNPRDDTLPVAVDARDDNPRDDTLPVAVDARDDWGPVHVDARDDGGPDVASMLPAMPAAATRRDKL